MRLTTDQAVALFLADGRRAVRDIISVLWALDLPVPPASVEAGFDALHKAGLAVDVDPRRLPQRVLPATNHRCVGCGKSCQSQRVGALSDEEIARIESIWTPLQALEPSLAGFSPFRRERGGVYLERVDSQCLFLDGHNRCMIHRHFGADHKPTTCQMYPFVRVLTETGTRLAVAPGCTRAHAHEPSEPNGELLASLPADTFDREVAVSHPLSLHGKFPLRRAFDLWERRLLALLDSPEVTLAGVAQFWFRRRDPHWITPSSARSLPACGLRVSRRSPFRAMRWASSGSDC